MQFGHIHFIFGTDFVYDLEKYSWFETFDKDSGQCDFDYLETFKTVIAAGSVMPGLEAAPPLLIYYWPQVISPPLPPSSLHQIHLQIWTNMLYILYKYTFDDFLLVPSHPPLPPLILLQIFCKNSPEISSSNLPNISLLICILASDNGWYLLHLLDFESKCLPNHLLLIGEASLDIDSPSFWRFSCPLRIVNIGGLWTIMDNRLRK